MRKNTLLALFVAGTIAFFAFDQATVSVSANSENLEKTKPISGPISRPVSVAMYKMGGKVTLKIFGKWLKLLKTVPLANIKVVVTNKDTKEVSSAWTGSDGSYFLSLPKGKYTVEPIDASFKFQPQKEQVNLKKDNLKVNFQATQKSR